MHCHNDGEISSHDEFDWKMEQGLNKQLLERGFETLKPHQVYIPCMGCREGFCN